MEDNRRRQYEQSGYSTARAYVPSASSASASGSSDRFRRPSQLSSSRSPASVTGTGAGGHGQEIEGYSYTQGPYTPQIQDSSLQYQPDFSQDAQRQQPFHTYSPNIMYNITSQAQQPSGYESVAQYQSRRPATAIEVLSSQLGVPQYYNTSEASTTSAPIPQAYSSTPFQQQVPYQQSSQRGRAANISPYQGTVSDYAQLGMSNVVDQQNTPQEHESTDDAYSTYLDTLKRTYQDAYDGKLVEAGQRLLELSEWLLGHADDLGKFDILRAGGLNLFSPGLTKDEQELQEQRIKLWNDFNSCWLVVLQRQKDITQEMIDSGQPPPQPQNILQEDFLERMARELVRMCDSMERHGLVDYQMGVWEEEIMSGKRRGQLSR